MKIPKLSPIVLLLVSVAKFSYAGAMHVDCLNPIAYPGASINVVFLPFERAADSAGKKSGYFAELSLLMQLDTLLHLLPYGSVGAVQLDPPNFDSRDCNAEEVTRRLFERGQIENHHGLIVVSGILYQEGNDYYVKTSATFERKGVSEAINFPMKDVTLSASPGRQSVSFEPRHLTRDQLQQMEAAYEKANVIRREPSLAAPGTPLPSPFSKCSNGQCLSDNLRYSVVEQRGQWFRIEWSSGGSGGWLLADADLGSEHLENFMPELYFIQGLAGYVVTRMRIQNSSQSLQTFETLSKQFSSYIEQEKDDDETEALAYALRGIATAELQQGDSGVADFNQSIPLDPSSADLRNLLACAQIWNAWQKKSSNIDGQAVIKGFNSAVALSGEKHPAAANLSMFYQAAQEGVVPNTGLSQDEIRTGVTRMKRK